MVHPVIKNPVANDLKMSEPILITGSNAAGKSTYIKTAALCAILAQAICVTTAQSYRAAAFRIYSSMAVTDNLSAGESYYIVEIKSLKRIFDAAEAGGKILCVIDEVLRVRTPSSGSPRRRRCWPLSGKGASCPSRRRMTSSCVPCSRPICAVPFEETLGEDDMVFDYKIKPGPAGTRNAITLLKLMGFDDGIVKRAHGRANRYMENGVWTLG
jgi:DNA mismatch repair ATPase MutS